MLPSWRISHRAGLSQPPRYEAEGQLLLAAVFDNLGKGVAGAAVQNLGLMLVGAR